MSITESELCQLHRLNYGSYFAQPFHPQHLSQYPANLTAQI